MNKPIAAIELAPLLEVALWSLAAVGLVLLVSVSLFGFSRGPEFYRHGRPVGAVGWIGVGVVCALASLAMIAYALVYLSGGSPLR